MMKQLFILLLAALAFVGCKDDKNKGRLDANAKVYINGKELPQSAAQTKAVAGEQQKLSIREVIEQANCLTPLGLTIDDWNRDLVNNRILGGSTWVIAQSGELTLEFITCRDMILVTNNHDLSPKDTIAYLPNAVMIEAEKKIRAAYDAEDYAACYRLFEEAFVFYPTTGKEWLELKAAGKN